VQQPRREQIGEQSYILRGFALPWLERLLPALEAVLAAAPFRQMITPGGFTMSVALSSCGALGWTTDRSGYRYTHHDPQTGEPWPDMPEIFLQLAQAAAQEAGFSEFLPTLPDQPIPPRGENVFASGQKRMHLRRADRLGIARLAGNVPVRRF
jgi:alkylated DNA repair protein (DNA oxidative demethylase)